MKKILSLLLSEETIESGAMPDSAELLHSDKGLYETVKQAKGKYAYLPDGLLQSADLQVLFEELDKTNADIVSFKGGYCIKTSVLKSLNSKLCTNGFTAVAYSAFASKNILNLDIQPFDIVKRKTEYSQEFESEISGIVNEFNRCKAKLPKEIYTFAFDLLVRKLVAFYICAMLAVYSKKLDPQVLKDFDAKLKANIVLYLALEEKFTAAKLSKLRQKDFKIDLFTNMKFKKLV